MNPVTLTLLLLGTFCVAASNDDYYRAAQNLDVKLYADGVRNTTFTFEDRTSTISRRKRTLAPFLRAWKSILKTVYGSRTLTLEGKEVKLYVKVGTSDDALNDFIALNPNNVVQDALGMRGIAGNKFIELRTLSTSGPQPPSLFVFGGRPSTSIPGVPGKPVTRVIYYFENKDLAKYIIENN